jgi:hypothetical protein
MWHRHLPTGEINASSGFVVQLLVSAGMPLLDPFGFLSGANLGQQFLRFSRLPLRVVQALACLTQVQLTQTRLRFFDASYREVQSLTHFSEPIKLRIFCR